MNEATSYYDVNGIPIHVGDLIRVKHYRHRRSKRQMWIYFRVAKMKGKYVVQNWDDLDVTKYQCSLADCSVESAEVLEESGLERNERGEIVTFNERPRVDPRIIGKAVREYGEEQ